MANCPVETNKLIGRDAVIRIAHGCPDTVPDQSAFFRIGALTTKSFDLSPNTLTSEEDDSKGLVESVVTSMDLTISFDGEYRKRDKNEDFGPLRLLKEIPKEVQAGRQPSYWVQMDFTGEDAFVLQGYMVFTSWSSQFGANEIATYSGELKVSDADTVDWLIEEIAVQSVAVSPSTMRVIQACCEDDADELIGEWRPGRKGIVYRPGRMPINDIIVVANELITHGVIGKVQIRKLQRHEGTEAYSNQFKAIEYINAAALTSI
nr:DUF6246 family protein [Xenorhabdus sp. ZM]